MAELQGRRALVTGGTRGIGAAIARHLDSAGARVVVAARSRGDYDGHGHFIAADVSTADGPRQLAADAAAHLGGIDILIDNAASQTLVPDGAHRLTWVLRLSASIRHPTYVRAAGQPRKAIYKIRRSARPAGGRRGCPCRYRTE